MRTFRAKILQGDQVILDCVEIDLDEKATCGQANWSGWFTCSVHEGGPFVTSVKDGSRLRIQLEDGRVGEFFATNARPDSSGMMSVACCGQEAFRRATENPRDEQQRSSLTQQETAKRELLEEGYTRYVVGTYDPTEAPRLVGMQMTLIPGSVRQEAIGGKALEAYIDREGDSVVVYLPPRDPDWRVGTEIGGGGGFEPSQKVAEGIFEEWRKEQRRP